MHTFNIQDTSFKIAGFEGVAVFCEIQEEPWKLFLSNLRNYDFT